ncbi:MAG: hypothetical protein PWQ97_1686 [Tepidanaerobacteraceae bacterium]|nr:hypothetical protein [Tepidanaerobacteraceae bacterium]
MDKRSKEYFRDCLLGGAIGDALGWPVEFLRLKIKNKYGKEGITDLVSENGKAEITDDTQMTLFTAEGLLRAESKGRFFCRKIIRFFKQRLFLGIFYTLKKKAGF